MRRLSWFIFGFAVAVMGVTISRAQGGPGITAETERVQQLLEQAREAIGGQAKLEEVHGLSVAAKMRHPDQDQEGMSNEIRLNFLFSDKSMLIGMANSRADVNRVFIKDEDYNGDQKGDSAGTNSGETKVKKTIRFRAFGEPGKLASLPGPHPDIAYYMLGWLLRPMLPVEFSYAGEAEDGSSDALDVKGSDGFAGRLFLDKNTHLPSMLRYRGVAPLIFVLKKTDQAGSEEKSEKILEDVYSKLPEPEEAEIELYFSDHRPVDGIMLPHHITKSVNGKLSEEWDVEKFEINPRLNILKSEKD